jgi:hypothetical protein
MIGLRVRSAVVMNRPSADWLLVRFLQSNCELRVRERLHGAIRSQTDAWLLFRRAATGFGPSGRHDVYVNYIFFHCISPMLRYLEGVSVVSSCMIVVPCMFENRILLRSICCPCASLLPSSRVASSCVLLNKRLLSMNVGTYGVWKITTIFFLCSAEIVPILKSTTSR